MREEKLTWASPDKMFCEEGAEYWLKLFSQWISFPGVTLPFITGVTEVFLHQGHNQISSATLRMGSLHPAQEL